MKELTSLLLLVASMVLAGCADGAGGGFQASSSFMVSMDEAMPKLYVHGATVEAGQPVRFLVTLDRPPRSVVRVQLGTRDGAGNAGDDYAAYSAELTLAPGDMIAEIEIYTYINPLRTETVDFTLEATEISGAVIQKARGLASILPAGLN